MCKDAQQLLCSEVENDRCAGIGMLVGTRERDDLEILVSHLEKESSTFVRRHLIVALGTSASLDTAFLAGNLLASPEAHVRNAALAVLQMLGEVSLSVLNELIHHHNSNVRKLAVDALDKISGDVACNLLISGLKDQDPNVVSTCAEALGNRWDSKIVPALTAVLSETKKVWVVFSIMESLAKTSDPTSLTVIEEYIHKHSWTREEYITLAGVWAVAVGKLGDEQNLSLAWKFYGDKILTIGQMLVLLDCLAGRGIPLQFEEVTIEILLERFFLYLLPTSALHEVIAAIHLAKGNCPIFLYRYLPILVALFRTTEVVMEELVTAIKSSYFTIPANERGSGMYTLLAYMYECDPYLEHRQFILACSEIFQEAHYQETWEWLVDSIFQFDPLIKIAGIRGMCNMGEKGKEYLKELVELHLEQDEEINELIRQELQDDWGKD